MAIWTMNGDGAVGKNRAAESGNRGAYNRLIEAIGRDMARRMVAVALLAGVALTTAVAALTIEVVPHDPARWTGWVLGALAICVGALMATLALLWHIATIVVCRRQAVAKADARRAGLVETFDAVPFGIALYDRDERLVAFNAAYNRMIGHIGGLDESMIGRTYEEILTHLESQLREIYPERDLTDWKSQYLDRFRRRETTDLLWEIGKTVRLMQVATASGGTALLRIDVTDLKRREEDARAAQRRFDRLVNTLSDTVYSTDREGRFNYLSGAVTQLLGYRPDELLGRTSRDIVHPDDHARLAEIVGQLRRYRGRPVAFEFRGQRKDGVERRMEVRMTALEKADNLDGEFAVTGAIRDVHEQHVLAKRLERQLQLLDALVQSTGATMVLIDREQRIVTANQEFMNAVPGRTPETVFGRHMRDVIRNPPDDAIFAGWFAAGQLDPISRFEYENRIRDGQGREHFFQVTANPVRDASGRVEHIVILGVDNTDRRAAELQLFDSARLATVGEMAAGVAHELNQPLTIMRLAAESLLEQLQDTPPTTTLADVTALINTKLTRVVGQSERAAAIIQELKGFARRPEAAPQPFDVLETLAAAAQLLREQLRLSGIKLTLDLDPDCPPVLGHAGRLQQVALNLIINGRDAILGPKPDAGGHRRGGAIRLCARRGVVSGKVVITVDDDGPGISAQAMPRLFEPFFTTKAPGKGTGLGLSVSYQIIRQMGGMIAATNCDEGGARFTITLDAVPAQIAEPTTPGGTRKIA